MKILITLALLILCSCKSHYERMGDKSSEAREFLINELEITDKPTLTFLNTRKPAFFEEHGVSYYWWRDKDKNVIYTVEANSESLVLVEAYKNIR